MTLLVRPIATKVILNRGTNMYLFKDSLMGNITIFGQNSLNLAFEHCVN